jgi:hypothetical protein
LRGEIGRHLSVCSVLISTAKRSYS